MRFFPCALFSVCASFRVRFFPMHLHTYALFFGALFSYVLFTSTLFTGHRLADRHIDLPVVKFKKFAVVYTYIIMEYY